MHDPTRRNVRNMSNRCAVPVLAICAAVLTACSESPTTASRNSAPVVTVAFDGPSSCAIKPGTTCTLQVVAQATDPDGDPLQYAWSGCAAGASPRATCTIAQIGQVSASVTVSDDKAHIVTAAITGEGVATPNGPPSAVVAFQGASSCTPLPAKPCTLAVAAQATDPDGDVLKYQWSGCASGTASSASCTVDRPGRVEATVQVSDDRGQTTTATAAGNGNNHGPGVHIGYISRFPGSTSYVLLGDVMDPDEGFLCGRQYCESASASGACRLTRFECTCLAGLETEVAATVAPTGSCTVTFTLKDSWGQAGTPSVTFDLANPRPPAAVAR